MGAAPGQIKLLKEGTVIGIWDAYGREGSGKQNVYWDALINITIQPGEYEIVDSDPDTWSSNSGSSGRGFAEIRGDEMIEMTEGY